MQLSTEALEVRLDGYLQQLSLTSTRWIDWLRALERAAAALQLDQLREAEADAEQLMVDLEKLKTARLELLADAEQVGLASPSLQSLARRLPAWRTGAFRNAVKTARTQVLALRRVQMSAWVLIHQLTHYYSGSLATLTAGATGNPAYVSSEKADVSSGSLLDENL